LQFDVVPSMVEHMFAGSPGQCIVPFAQLLSTHAPATHVSMPWHTVPQTPQFIGSLWTFASQPFPGLPSQSVQPESQFATVHAPAAQPAVACGTVQMLPHAPQFIGSVPVWTSHPLAMLPSQLLKPVWQLPSVHMALTHVASALAYVGHGVHCTGSHPNFGSVMSMHMPLQTFCPLVQFRPPSPSPASPASVALPPALLVLGPEFTLPPMPPMPVLVLPLGPEFWVVVPLVDPPPPQPVQPANSAVSTKPRNVIAVAARRPGDE
jgi:hypothetical protein